MTRGGGASGAWRRRRLVAAAATAAVTAAAAATAVLRHVAIVPMEVHVTVVEGQAHDNVAVTVVRLRP